MRSNLAVGSAGVNGDWWPLKPRCVGLRPFSLARSDAWNGDHPVAKFHNGRPLEASEMVFTYKRILAKASAARRAEHYPWPNCSTSADHSRQTSSTLSTAVCTRISFEVGSTQMRWPLAPTSANCRRADVRVSNRQSGIDPRLHKARRVDRKARRRGPALFSPGVLLEACSATTDPT
jgi:hypothetical protein